MINQLDDYAERPIVPRCVLCLGEGRDVYAPITRTGLRMPPVCGPCQHHINVTARGMLRRSEKGQVPT